MENRMQRIAGGTRPALLEPFHQGVQGGILAQLLSQQLVDAAGRPRAVQAFQYAPAVWDPITANTTADRTVQISNSHDFLVFSTIGIARNPAAPFADDPDAALVVSIVSNASDQNLTERATDFFNVFGTAQRPHYLPVPLFWRGGSSVTISLTNNMATDVRVRVIFEGAKVFYGPMEG